MKKSTAIFTVCSNNYLAYARVLVQSAQRYHPDSDVFICLADDIIPRPDVYPDNCTIVPAKDIGVPEFNHFSFRYDIMEFNTAVKPYMFLHLFGMGYNEVLYFDPDIEIFSRLENILSPLRSGASFILTPHLCKPMGGNTHPSDLSIMRAGVYNLGFLAASRSGDVDAIIRWWARRLRYECVNAQEQGIFVDQKFFDLVPGFIDNILILKDPNVNIAYWNLPQRQLKRTGDGWSVDDLPLGFFHFSGFDPKDQSRLSKHTHLFRGDLSPPLRAIMRHYADNLLANGYRFPPSGLYAYGRFASGTPIPFLVRRMFRERQLTWAGNPFETYEEYLHLPHHASARGTSGFVTNFMAFLRESEPWLERQFDIRDSVKVDAFLEWYVHYGLDLGLDSRLIEPVAQNMGALRRSRQTRHVRAGGGADVSVVGYLRTTSGVGEIGRLTLKALDRSGVKVEGYDVDLNVVSDRSNRSCDPYLAPVASGRTHIFNINADQLPLVLEHSAPNFRPEAYRIAIPFWELSKLPDAWVPNFKDIDEVWAPSGFIQKALATRLPIPVIKMPVALEVPSKVRTSRKAYRLPEDKFLFMFAFDFLSYPERKNPSGLVEAFRRAFRGLPQEGRVGLVIKCLNSHYVSNQLRDLYNDIADDHNIFLIDGTLTREQTLGLIQVSDCIVSLHRSEGLGLLVAEAMALAKPVISTDYSATTELISPETGYPIGYRLAPVEEGQYPFPEGQVWADPDLDHAAWHMREVFADYRAAELKGQAALSHIRTTYDRQHVSRLQVGRLRHLGLI